MPVSESPPDTTVAHVADTLDDGVATTLHGQVMAYADGDRVFWSVTAQAPGTKAWADGTFAASDAAANRRALLQVATPALEQCVRRVRAAVAV